MLLKRFFKKNHLFFPSVVIRIANKPLCTQTSGNVSDNPSNSGNISLNSPSTSNLPRPVRGEPGKVRLGFIPDEWFLFFQQRTGVSGFYTFCFTTGTYLFSKEIYVLEHNYYGGLSMALLCYVATQAVGAEIAKSLDKEIDLYEGMWIKHRENEKKAYEEQIEDEEHLQFSMDGQLIILEAKRENVALQLEEEYRIRLLHVYETVKKRLDYFVIYGSRKKMYIQRNINDWVLKKVHESLTPEFLDDYLNHCIDQIAKLFK